VSGHVVRTHGAQDMPTERAVRRLRHVPDLLADPHARAVLQTVAAQPSAVLAMLQVRWCAMLRRGC
jgi:hypothetical protein